MIRIHLCQIFYNPAYYDGESDFLEEPAPILSANATIGMVRQNSLVASFLIESRAQYIRHITEKLTAIASWSALHEADILVFPEYSVPIDSLAALARVAKDHGVVIVAGTHRVRMTELSKPIYGQIGLNLGTLQNGSAVSPILFPSGKVELSAKVSRSKWEPNLNVAVEPQSTHPAEIDKTKVLLAVTPCIDSLKLDVVGSLLGGTASKPTIWVCPSLSPSTGYFHDVGNLMAGHEVVFAFANNALYGGTGFNVPNKWAQFLPGHGSQIASLPPRTEAILEIDVEPGAFVLKHGSITAQPPCTKCKGYPVIYSIGTSWIHSYYQLKNDVLDLLKANDSSAAAEFVDGFLSEQQVSLPQEIIGRLKELRYGELVLYSGDSASVEKSFEIIEMKGLEESRLFFAKRLVTAISTVSDAIKTSFSNAETTKLIEYLQTLKLAQQDFLVQEIIQETGLEHEPMSLGNHLDISAFKPSDDSLASFQNRGVSLESLREKVSSGAERVISINGVIGIGKTQLLRTFFLKVLPDWKTIWIPVARDSSTARVVAEIGNAMGIYMDVDSLASCNAAVFRSKAKKLCDAFFGQEKYALVPNCRDIFTLEWRHVIIRHAQTE